MGRQIYKGRIVDLRLERVTLPNGATIELELMHHPGAAAVVALDEQSRVVLLRQYRYAAGGYIWELPAGILDGPDEAPVACAARELREEAGVGPVPGATAASLGVIKVPDPRVDTLAGIYHPRKTTYAEITFVDFPPSRNPVERRAVLDAATITQLRDADALVEVVRGFP